MYRFFLAFRYLRTRLISYIATFVLAVMVAILIVVTSVMGGFQREYHKKIRGTLADISVGNDLGFQVEDEPALSKRIEKNPHVKATAPYVNRIVLIQSPISTDWGNLVGIDPVREVVVGELGAYMLSEQEVWDVEYENYPEEVRESPTAKAARAKRSAEKPTPDALLAVKTATGLPPILVGSQLYGRMMMRLPQVGIDGIHEPGDILTLLSAGTVDSSQPLREEDTREQKFEVVGVFKTGVYETDRRMAYASLSSTQAFLGIGRRVSGVNVKLEDHEKAEEVSEDLKTRLGDLDVYVLPWYRRNETLIQAVNIERFMIYFIVLAMMLLASLSLSAILTMSVVEKTKDLGILGAVGATRGGRFTIFLLQGGIIGALGSVFGTLLGLVFVYNVNWIDEHVMKALIGKKVFDPSVYYLDAIPADVNVFNLALSVIPPIVIGFVVAVYPAYRAARLDPIEALRYE